MTLYHWRKPDSSAALPLVVGIESCRILATAEILMEGKRITAVGSTTRNPEAELIDSGDRTLMSRLIDVHG